MAPRGRTRFQKVHEYDSDFSHLVLLCRNEEGYRNLSYMVSQAFLEGFYMKPRIDLDLLREHCGGLIACSACLGGSCPGCCSAGDYDKAKEVALEMRELVRGGRLLPGTPGPRHPRPAAGERGADAPPPGDGHPPHRHQRRPLPAPGGRRDAGHSHVHPDGQDGGRPQPHEVRDPGVLRQERGGDGVPLPRLPGGPREHRQNRGSVQCGVRVRQVPPAPLPAARGLDRRGRLLSATCAWTASAGRYPAEPAGGPPEEAASTRWA